MIRYTVYVVIQSDRSGLVPILLKGQKLHGKKQHQVPVDRLRH